MSKRKNTKIQAMLLKLMREASFNDFDGNIVVDSLLAHRDLWIACMIDREAYQASYERERRANGEKQGGLPVSPIDTIRLRDISEGYWNVDALFILPEPGKEDELELLARKEWNADEIDWYDPLDAGLIMHGSYEDTKGSTRVEKMLRVWWD